MLKIRVNSREANIFKSKYTNEKRTAMETTQYKKLIICP